MRPFARVAQDLDADERVAALPTDGARYAFVVSILQGKRLGGRWESRAHWAATVGRNRLRYLDALIRVGLIEELPSGTVRFRQSSWASWQADPTGVARQRKHREIAKGEDAGGPT